MAEKQDAHSKRANAIQKARHLLHHAGYATGGKVRPEGGGENEPGAGKAGDESLQSQDGSADKNMKSGGRAHGDRAHRRLDRKPRAGGGNTKKEPLADADVDAMDGMKKIEGENYLSSRDKLMPQENRYHATNPPGRLDPGIPSYRTGQPAGDPWKETELNRGGKARRLGRRHWKKARGG